MQTPNTMANIFKRLLLRGTAFNGAYHKLHALYSLEDPWQMASEREQYRFKETNKQLSTIKPKFHSILELGAGEGHQSQYLQALTDKLVGIDVSSKAVARAKKRCPSARFEAIKVEDIRKNLPEASFDLITACEVLYYAKNIPHILSILQSRTDKLYISNYHPRSEKMRENFTGPGWTQLNSIKQNGTVWECFLWQAAKP